MCLCCEIVSKNVANYALLWCKTFGLKIRRCKIFDKFHVCQLAERKVTEFQHNVDKRRYLVWFKWLIFITFPRQSLVSVHAKLILISEKIRQKKRQNFFYDNLPINLNINRGQGIPKNYWKKSKWANWMTKSFS